MAHHRHKRDANARRTHRGLLIAAPLAILATASAVTLGVADADLSDGGASAGRPGIDVARQRRSTGLPRPRCAGADIGDAASPVSRRRRRTRPGSGRRTGQQGRPLMNPKQKWRGHRRRPRSKRWTTEDLNLWTEPGKKARKTGELVAGQKVLLTGRSLYGRDEIVWGGKQTTAGSPAATSPPRSPFALGRRLHERHARARPRVSPNIVKVHAAVCAAFPDISAYGTFRSDGEHSQGIAVDIMVSGSEGYRVADFVRANDAELGVSYVIYAQRIWSVERGGEGWRAMSDRGSATADHYDHVHVTTY